MPMEGNLANPLIRSGGDPDILCPNMFCKKYIWFGAQIPWTVDEQQHPLKPKDLGYSSKGSSRHFDMIPSKEQSWLWTSWNTWSNHISCFCWRSYKGRSSDLTLGRPTQANSNRVHFVHMQGSTPWSVVARWFNVGCTWGSPWSQVEHKDPLCHPID